MTQRFTFTAQASAAETVVQQGSARKGAVSRSQGELLEAQLAEGAETLRWFADHPEAVEAAKAAVKGGRR